MKLRVKRKDGKIVLVTLVSEDEADKEVLEALWYYDVTRGHMIYRRGYVVLQGRISPYPRH
jgi:hypothetical protein